MKTIYNILFADESQMINEVMKFAFENDDFQVDIYSDLNDLDKKIDKHYELLLLSEKLGGVELLKDIRNRFDGKIFIISDKAEHPDKRKAKEYGADGWVVKPMVPEKFVKTVKFFLFSNRKRQ